LKVQDQLLQVARDSLRTADDAHIASYSAARTEFPIGSYVLLTYPTEPPTHLHPRKRGPFEVVKFHNNDYTLRVLVSNKELTVHVTRLTPFEHDPVYTDPRLVANVDQEAFDVESILAHRGNLNRKGTLEFRVRWAGYDETSDTWEPWKNLRTNEQLHLYLRKKGLSRLLPSQFR
jgi:Chromo (CHRromatin Organisation MOdifier) domain